ncbi:MAG: protein with putative role during mitosis [Chaenotheca gracillima]|nr:MAG: protein with putative role during mitosis [Chaenotheca gracillima]
MSRRLSQMTEQALEEGGRGVSKTLAESGFSEELRQKLEERLEEANFRSDHAAAFAQVDLPVSAGKGTREMAAAQPWTGAEQTEDAVLRMLVDTHKPLKGFKAPKTPSPRAPPPGLPRRAPRQSTGQRLANARDRTSIYSLGKDTNLSEAERAQMKKEMKERFSPGARPMPTSLQGLASLANERIEDAIARGQFKNIPRGKAVERDYNMSSPFLDTTEYFMNKIIQKQEIVPPWIEKQQELAKAADTFRRRLRADWRRHAARSIASKGGPLDTQVKQAKAYAAAEELVAPKPPGGGLQKGGVEVLENSKVNDDEATLATATAVDTINDPTSPDATFDSNIPSGEATTSLPPPFRDPKWQDAERSYHKLAIDNLNSLCRSYNLMAPDLAKKPYYSLDRELRACFAEVAPHLANEIVERSRAPIIRVEKVGHTPGGVLEKFGAGESTKIYDSRKPKYGFKEFWKDLWSTG